MQSPKMPTFNIFVMVNSPEDEDEDEKKKEKDKKGENNLAKMLKKSDKNENEMISHMKAMAAKMAGTSHAGGG